MCWLIIGFLVFLFWSALFKSEHLADEYADKTYSKLFEKEDKP